MYYYKVANHGDGPEWFMSRLRKSLQRCHNEANMSWIWAWNDMY
jgi:hypothetical protein